ncbi:right-handed parallel beta-helix repeat-containing protein [Burkholderia stabilis]
MNTRNLVACVSVALAACGGDGGGGIPAAGMASARAAAPIPAGSSIYVDCSQSNDGTGSQASPFNRLADLATTIGAGTHLYFKRGATCAGQFVSQGSGTAAAPIVVAAYGTGTARPVIAGNVAGHGAAGAAVALTNQEYWEIHDLEITNTAAQRAERNGILVLLQGFQNGTDAGGNPIGVGHHYLIDNVYVHDVYGNNDDRNDQNATPGVTGNKWSNGIQFRVTGTAIPNRFDGVTVQNSEIATVDREGLTTWSDQNCRTQFGCTGTQNWLASTNVVFKGNTIHDIGGDGIVIRASQNAQVYGNLGYDRDARAQFERRILDDQQRRHGFPVQRGASCPARHGQQRRRSIRRRLRQQQSDLSPQLQPRQRRRFPAAVRRLRRQRLYAGGRRALQPERERCARDRDGRRLGQVQQRRQRDGAATVLQQHDLPACRIDGRDHGDAEFGVQDGNPVLEQHRRQPRHGRVSGGECQLRADVAQQPVLRLESHG